jgi:hypothetical protein
MKYSRAVESNTDEDTSSTAGDEQEVAVTAATKNILSKLQKKNIIENIVPVIVEFKHFLSVRHSPLLRYLVDYLKEIMSDYKNELEEILTCDPQLAKEIEFDIRQHEKQFSAKINGNKAILPPISLTPAKTPLLPIFSPRRTPIKSGSGFVVPNLRAGDILKMTPYKPSPAKNSPTFLQNKTPGTPVLKARDSRPSSPVSPVVQEKERIKSFIQRVEDAADEKDFVESNEDTPKRDIKTLSKNF